MELAAICELMIQLVRTEVDKRPDVTGAEIVEILGDWKQTEQDAQHETRQPCKNCKHPIEWLPGVARWQHVMDSGKVSNVGCLAASYDRSEGSGWDRTVPGKWRARPVPERT